MLQMRTRRDMRGGSQRRMRRDSMKTMRVETGLWTSRDSILRMDTLTKDMKIRMMRESLVDPARRKRRMMSICPWSKDA